MNGQAYIYFLLLVFAGISLPSRTISAGNAVPAQSYTYLEVYPDNDSVMHSILHAKGIGKLPRGNRSSARARLLSKRAAQVDAYRKLLHTLQNNTNPIRTGIIRTDGFLQGVALHDQQYFIKKGFTQVDMILFLETDEYFRTQLQKKGVPVKEITKEEYLRRRFQADTIDEKEWDAWDK